MTQQEDLNAFLNRRMSELGLGYKALTNAGIGGQTLQNIRNNVPFRMGEVTKEKLAKALQCSIGDINAALSQTTQDTPFGECVTKSAKTSVMKAVDKLEEMIKDDYPNETDANPDESESVPEETGAKSDKIESISAKTVTKVEHTRTVPEPVTVKVGELEGLQEKLSADKPKPKRKKIVSKGLTEAEPAAETTNTQTVEEYRQQLKDMCLKEFARFGCSGTMEVAYVAIAKKLLRDLLGGEPE